MEAVDVLQTSFIVSPLFYNSQGPHRFKITLIPWYVKMSGFLWPNQWRLACRKETSFILLCPSLQGSNEELPVYHVNTI
eukprot:scaffold2841_cov31-Attheya_sp.AAC.4